MKKLLVLVSILVLALICYAQVPAGPDWVTIERTSPTTCTVRWSAEPSEFVALYYISVASTDHIYVPPFGGDGNEPPWNSGDLPGFSAPLEDYLESPGVYKFDHPLVLDPAKDYIAYVAANNAAWTWNASSSLHNPYIPTLPVTLSSFSSTLTAQNYVQLNWTTESETNMLGFRILRSELEDLSSATLITPVMISATNTSTTQHYSLTDSEVMIGSTYYYWLEAVDMGTSSYHGPQSVTVTGSSTPALPGITALGNAYPNPFRQSTNISLAVKEGENASVTIYNIMGQVVRTFSKGQGNHLISWDGRDSRGKACGSGIYFYKLSSSSLNQTKKLIIVK